MPIRRRNHGNGHSYHDEHGKVPGVTTIQRDGFPKKQLIDWAGNVTAEYALDYWDELSRLRPSERLNRLRRARYETRDKARDRGTDIHKIAVALTAGEEVEYEDELAPYVESYVQWLDDWNVQPILQETTIVNYKHRYAGTLDLAADLNDGYRWLIDLKHTSKGPYGDTAFQLAGYRYAECYVDDEGNEQPMIEVQRTGVAQIRADGVDLFPIPAGERQFRQFLYIKQVAIAAEESQELVGRPLRPPRRRAH